MLGDFALLGGEQTPGPVKIFANRLVVDKTNVVV